MSHVYIGLSHDPKNLISRFIAWLTVGKSHVVLISPCGQWFIEASGKSLAGYDTGVRLRPICEFLDQPNAIIKRKEHPNPELCWEKAKSQLGKGYDWGWMRGYLMRDPHWQDPNKWTCGELLAWAFDDSGGNLFPGRDDYHWHVTPAMIDMVFEVVPNDEGKDAI